MNIEDIEIVAGKPGFEYKAVRRLEVKCEATNALMPAPTIAEANGRLRALAAKVGANAIVEVDYNSGISFTSWKSLKATGLAVVRQSEDVTCDICAETIKRAAIKCRHCGADRTVIEAEMVQGDIAVAVASLPSAALAADMQEPLKDNNNPVIIIAICAVGLFFLFMLISAGN